MKNIDFLRAALLFGFLFGSLSLFPGLAIAQDKGEFKDIRDGKTYGWVKIGNQVWMSKNLDFIIPNGCWAYNNDARNAEQFGRLYDWNTARNICPPGWHLPADSEWTILVDFLGGDKIAGGKIKEPGKEHWYSPNETDPNPSGFSAVGAGYKADAKTYADFGKLGYFWSSTFCPDEFAFYRCMNFGTANIYRYCGNQNFGLSVRCIRDK
jgi:uncharacterized protein (TIGR02145 family)